MRKIIAAINMTLDGFCDHTAGIADAELHQHYTDLLHTADTILYGRITYQLMEFWKTILEEPTGNKSMDEFAVAIDNIEKIVFSRTLEKVDWETATLAVGGLEEEVLKLRQQPGRDILVGSPALIVALMNLNLVDEFQICIHPVILANGSNLLLKNIHDKINLELLKTKTFGSGVIACYYAPKK